ncbi:MAG: ATP-binding protein [Pseudonocardiaceae bacterium]
MSGHRDVLFLDEVAEFRPRALEALRTRACRQRQPLLQGTVQDAEKPDRLTRLIRQHPYRPSR